MYSNDSKLIEDVVKMKGESNRTWSQIAEVINRVYNTAHTGDSVRAVWRRRILNGRKIDEVPSLPQVKSRYGTFVPLQLNPVNVLIVPDLHIPFVAPGYFNFLQNVRDKYNLSTVICIGDIVDQYALSTFEKSPASLSADNELLISKKMLQQLVKLFPEMHVCIGNHDNRHLRAAKKAGLPEAYIRDFLEIFDLPDNYNWHWSFIINNDIVVEHGTASGVLATYQRAWALSKNVIQGHTHAYGGVIYMNDGLTSRWAMNVGCGVDSTQYAFHYALDRQFQSTLGCGILLDGVPHFIPFK